ncbi:hypothetical protein [Mediterraneibacter agrestimuris]|nr:hypothetical protein [Mediterraneibacter agrestimuris]
MEYSDKDARFYEKVLGINSLFLFEGSSATLCAASEGISKNALIEKAVLS